MPAKDIGKILARLESAAECDLRNAQFRLECQEPGGGFHAGAGEIAPATQRGQTQVSLPGRRLERLAGIGVEKFPVAAAVVEEVRLAGAS